MSEPCAVDLDGRVGCCRATPQAKSAARVAGRCGDLFGGWARRSQGGICRSNRCGQWREPNSWLLLGQCVPGGNVQGSVRLGLLDSAVTRRRGCQWRILVRRSGLAEGYTTPSNYSSTRPDFLPGFAAVGCLVKGRDLFSGWTMLLSSVLVSVCFGGCLGPPPSFGSVLFYLATSKRRKHRSFSLAFMEARAQAIPSSWITPTTRKDNILLFRRYVHKQHNSTCRTVRSLSDNRSTKLCESV
jgi:hypothetical protein